MCKTCKKSLLDVENAILIRYDYYTAKTRALYESTHGPAGHPAGQPAQFRRVVRCPSNRTQIDGSGVWTTWTAILETGWF